MIAVVQYVSNHDGMIFEPFSLGSIVVGELEDEGRQVDGEDDGGTGSRGRFRCKITGATTLSKRPMKGNKFYLVNGTESSIKDTQGRSENRTPTLSPMLRELRGPFIPTCSSASTIGEK
ncbi:hypothetical protein BDBG_16061 [Blastomyces gilchristii SLH14081]|uniref:Uncharacterized protein n=1 Tax=Blastomyces gilchristii (strain SLH14081) TaxID=559298 RepID=A0A179U6L2_BLAGS|nr:uncharacterized protein BDBG_16061 [Blastomyces gilchristii SLH14081]OAT03460.1 hypothetical protein BDBG_16061 [Blastomyces gilchristii SLH14081]